MVLKGQFLERPTLIPVGKGTVLEGLWHRGQRRPALLILPPRPEEGGSMDHVVAAELAWACSQAGFPSLRFNFRGVGASQGARGGPRTQLHDAEAALRLLEENIGGAAVVCAAVGGSAERALELGRRHPGLLGLCLVSPAGVRPADLHEVKLPLKVVIGAQDLREPRLALATSVTEAGGEFELIEDADQGFTRNLPRVGRSVAAFLERLA